MPFNTASLLALSVIFAIFTPAQSAPAIFARHDGHDDTSVSGTAAGAAPTAASSSFSVKQNALDAQGLNAKFKAIKATDACQTGDMACVEGKFGQCVAQKWVLTNVPPVLTCYALPLLKKAGTSIVCDSQADATQRFTDAGVTGGVAGEGSVATPAATTSVAASVPTSTTSPVESDDCDDDAADDDNDDGSYGDDDCEAGDDPSTSSAPVKVKAVITSATASTSAAATLANKAQGTVTKTVTLLPSGVNPKNVAFTSLTLERRQLLSSSTAVAAAATITTVPVIPATAVTTPTAVPTPATPSSSSNAVVTPTLAVGQNGIVTVTVVSVTTVTVSATSCATPSAVIAALPNTIPAAVTVVNATPSPSTIVPVFTPATASSSSSSSSSAIATLVAATAPVTTASAATTTPVTTATPTPTVANTPSTNTDLSFLLTATIGQQ